MDAAARIQSVGCQESGDGKKPNATMLSIATNPPAFDATDRNAVTGVGALIGVGGPEVDGTALTLNANPPSVRRSPTAKSGARLTARLVQVRVDPAQQRGSGPRRRPTTSRTRLSWWKARRSGST